VSKPLPIPTPSVIYRRVGEGGVLLSTTQEVYYGLNAVGAYIWEHLPPVLTEFAELSASLAITYPEVDRDTIRVDAQELLDDLLTHGLVSSAQQEGSHAANEPAGAAQAARAEPR
jgi:hypothetical protein